MLGGEKEAEYEIASSSGICRTAYEINIGMQEVRVYEGFRRLERGRKKDQIHRKEKRRR